MAALATALRDPGDLDELLERAGPARVVLLGGASQGTHELSAWRAALTRRLIEEHGFSFVLVEGGLARLRPGRPQCAGAAGRMPPAREESLEEVLHAMAPAGRRSSFRWGERPFLLTDEIAHRGIGVVHRPDRERWSTYVPTVLGERYDAFLWFDETRAVRPLHPATFASGLHPRTL